MAVIIEGLLRHVDEERGQVVIGSETFEILQGLPWPADLAPGTGVTALVADRGGPRRLIHMQPTPTRGAPSDDAARGHRPAVAPIGGAWRCDDR